MRQIASAVLIIGTTLGAPGAFACSFPIRHHTDQEIKEMAAQALASASLVVDGEVIQPMLIPYPDGTIPVAYVKVSHKLRLHGIV
jgi:hypothetical protein